MTLDVSIALSEDQDRPLRMHMSTNTIPDRDLLSRKTMHSSMQPTPPASPSTAPLQQFQGKHALLIGHRPTALITSIASSLVNQGANVTVALRHRQDADHVIAHVTGELLHRKDDEPAKQGEDPANLTGSSSKLQCSGDSLNMVRLSSIQQFAQRTNSMARPVDLLMINTWDLHAAGSKDRRWYTPQGLAGTAQTGFLGPAVLLHLLQPKLAASSTAVLLTASPNHRLAALDNLPAILTSWGHSTSPATQAALLAYARHLATHLHQAGVKVAAIDLGVLSEQPLKGSLLRKLPVLRQVLYTMLPSARDAAGLLTDVAAHMLSDAAPKHSGGEPMYTSPSGRLGTSSFQGGPADEHSAAATTTIHPLSAGVPQLATPHSAAGHEGPFTDNATGTTAAHPAGPALPLGVGHPDSRWAQKSESDPAAVAVPVRDSVAKVAATAKEAAGRVVGAATGAASAVVSTLTGLHTPLPTQATKSSGTHTHLHSPSGGAWSPFSYISRGMMASPLVTAFDFSGSTTWISRSIHTLTAPIFEVASFWLIFIVTLTDWPVRKLLAQPAGWLVSFVPRLSPLQALCARLVPNWQVMLRGIMQASDKALPAWVEVLPSGTVLDDRLGRRLWYLVDGYACLQA